MLISWSAVGCRAVADGPVLPVETGPVSAVRYPGTAGVDPPREDNWPQLKYTLPSLGLIVLGDWTEHRRHSALSPWGATALARSGVTSSPS